MAEVRLDGVTKSFGGKTVVDDLSLTVRDREFLTLVGPSGCGKSTTLRMICGLERASAGQIYFDDQPVGWLPANKRDVSMVFQSYALYPHKTVEQNIGFALKMLRVPKDEIARQVREAAGTLDILDLLDRRPRELSGGQRQRVALGRAIVREAGAYLLDEPLSNLDAQLRVLMRAEIKRLHVDLARTFIYVTHDQVEAMTMSDRIAVMKDGVVHQCATPDEIYARPANRFVASFMGSPPMNFLTRERVVLGIRPENVSLSVTPREGHEPGEVFITEPLGADVLVTVRLDGELIKARVAAPFHLGHDRTIHIGLDRTKLHYFSVEDGRAIEEGKAS
jgi:multiple sugar transport system ATP-binding protein